MGDCCQSCGIQTCQKGRFCTKCGARISLIAAGAVSSEAALPDDQTSLHELEHRGHHGTEGDTTFATTSTACSDTSGSATKNADTSFRTLCETVRRNTDLAFQKLSVDSGSRPVPLVVAAGTILLVLTTLTVFLVAHNSGLSPSRNAIPSLNGTWTCLVADRGNGKLYRSTLHITQRGTTLSGVGTEHNVGFSIKGLYDYPRIRFEKTFSQGDLQTVTFEGRITDPAKIAGTRAVARHMAGDWWLTGGFLQWNIDNTWIADMRDAGPPEPTDEDYKVLQPR